MIARQHFDNVLNWLTACRRPLLVSHRRPDGDALGALTAMTLTLRALGQDPRPALFETFPPRYALLRDPVRWYDWKIDGPELQANCDALVILDTCTWSQLEPIAAFVRAAPRTLVIDHHPTPDDIGTRPGDLRLLDDTAAATCLIILDWLRAERLPVDPPVATALLVGLGTDCGWFRYANTDTRALRAAAELSAAGVMPSAIYQAVYEQDPPARLRLVGRLLQSLELLAEGRLARMTLRRADFEAAGADDTLTEDLVNEASRLAGLEASVLFVEERDGRVRINLRSKRDLDVATIATQFGGGGHIRAAGARLKLPWDEAVARVTAALVSALQPRPR